MNPALASIGTFLVVFGIATLWTAYENISANNDKDRPHFVNFLIAVGAALVVLSATI